MAILDRIFIKKRKIQKYENIVSTANYVISCVKAEKMRPSKWNEFELDLVEKEMSEIINAITDGKKIPSSKKRMLDSTYLLTDSIGLSSTNLGKNIQYFQNAIRKL